MRTNIATNVSLHCDVCANPAADYVWTYNGDDLRDGIDGEDTDTITIQHVDESDFGIYTCEVSNTHGSRQLDIELVPYSKYSLQYKLF